MHAAALAADPVGDEPQVPGTAALTRLVAAVEAALASGERAAPVAEALAPFLRRGDLLTPADCVPAEGCYARNLLHAAADGSFSIWAMVWQAGQGSSIHDHSCWCVMGVHEGRLTEEAFAAGAADGTARCKARAACGAGAVRALDPGADDIHRIVNDGTATAVSIHIYGFDPSVVASSVGRTYAA